MKEFWQMIWQERVEKIVMVTQLVEGSVVTFYYSL
jgi:protein tyrosine phosphatase